MLKLIPSPLCSERACYSRGKPLGKPHNSGGIRKILRILLGLRADWQGGKRRRRLPLAVFPPVENFPVVTIGAVGSMAYNRASSSSILLEVAMNRKRAIWGGLLF